ncbi:MAG: CDP-alcohol phosphatidyltransferase family protein [Candidatus Saccharimonadales bacterium]|nr:CDP-alcohol phosphatidyltransferase family protein [Candidatus Saccharimonadales bacterium]
MKIADPIRDGIRLVVRQEARFVDWLFRGRVTANHITWLSLAMHIPIAVAIILEYYDLGALLIVLFGLMDALDGELARLQNRTSDYGVFLDASTDRIKESLVYLPLIFVFADEMRPAAALVAALALAGSLSVSYIKARGETVLKESRLSAAEINRVFNIGFARYEVRMAIMVIGFLLNEPFAAVSIVAVSAWLTAFYRLLAIGNKLR